MEKKSTRIVNSIKNARVAVFFHFINLIVQFFFRKIFLDELGPEVLGLNTTAMNLLQFLNIAELGVGAAVSYSLYSPLSKRNFNEVNEIISVLGYLYSRIGLIVLFAGLLLMGAFPLIFADINLPNWYPYATFGVLFLSSLSSYFFNYQQVLFISDQKEFKLNYVLQGVKLIKVSLQLLSIVFLNNGYFWWIFWDIVSIGIIILGLKKSLNKEFPWLKTDIDKGKNLTAKYSQIVLKTKQLFAHKIAGFALSEVTPLIIFAYTSLSFIALYGNYLLMIAGITALVGAAFNSVNASIGNLVSENDQKKIENVFEELFTIRFLFAVICCYSGYKLIPVFVTYWLGSNYILDDSIFSLMILLMFINLTRLTVDSFINAYGLFNDVAAPIIEFCINILLSIILGSLLGVKGVLIGVLISNIIIVLFWKPFFLFTKGLNAKPKKYFMMYLSQIAISCSMILLSEYILHSFTIDPYTSLYKFITFSMLVAGLIFLLLFSSFLLLTNGLRLAMNRVKKIMLY